MVETAGTTRSWLEQPTSSRGGGLGAQWAGPSLGVPSCPEPPGAALRRRPEAPQGAGGRRRAQAGAGAELARDQRAGPT